LKLLLIIRRNMYNAQVKLKLEAIEAPL